MNEVFGNISISEISKLSMVVNLVLDFVGIQVLVVFGFKQLYCAKSPILDLYWFREQHIMVIKCYLLILQV